MSFGTGKGIFGKIMPVRNEKGSFLSSLLVKKEPASF